MQHEDTRTNIKSNDAIIIPKIVHNISVCLSDASSQFVVVGSEGNPNNSNSKSAMSTPLLKTST